MDKYNKKAVDKLIKRDKSISKKEAKLIHALLKGRGQIMKKNKKNKKEEEIDSFIQLCKDVSKILKNIKEL